MSSLFRRKLDELEDMFITSQDDLLARFSATYEENARLKAEVERLKSNDSIIVEAQVSAGKSVVHYLAEIERLKAEVERLTAFTTRTIIPNEELQAQVERLTKAVMHSPAAQLKLKELEGKNTYEEINPKEGKQSNG